MKVFKPICMIDVTAVQEYDKLSPKRQELLKRTFKSHFDCMSDSMKKKYVPIKVEAINVGVKVIMKDKTWFHYSFDGTWY